MSYGPDYTSTDEDNDDMYYEAHPPCETCAVRLCNADGPDSAAFALEVCEGGCISGFPVVTFAKDAHAFCATCAPVAKATEDEDAAIERAYLAIRAEAAARGAVS